MRRAALLSVGLCLAGCAERLCEPGSSRDCACPGAIGQMRCDVKGSAWLACECPAAPKAGAPVRGAITEIVRAEDLGPADPKSDPDHRIVRITFRVSGPLAGEPTLRLASGARRTARAESGLDPNASEQARIFLVPSGALSGLRLGVGPDDPGRAVGELSSVPAAERFRLRQLREHR